jgi:vacuolar iron transporter family protein
MSLGAYLAAVTDRDHYFSEEKRERLEVEEKPEVEREECCEILQKYGVSNEAASMVVRDLCKDREKWVQVSIALLQAVLFCVRG